MRIVVLRELDPELVVLREAPAVAAQVEGELAAGRSVKERTPRSTIVWVPSGARSYMRAFIWKGEGPPPTTT